MESNHHVPLGTQGPQAEDAWLPRAESAFQSQIHSGYPRLFPVISGSHWRITGARASGICLIWRRVKIKPAKSAKPSQTFAASANISSMEFAHVRLSGDRAGEYVVTEERPDGSLTLAPDTSFEAIRKRLGTEPGTLADFEAEYGPVQPPDGEG